MNQDFDPMLRACRKEMEAVMKKYNVSGLIALSSGNGMGEFGLNIDTPTWSNFRWIKDDCGHFKIHMLSDKTNTERTVNAICGLADMNLTMLKTLHHLIGEVKKHVQIEATEGKIYPSED